MVSILGCGWYGLALGKALAQAGEKVKGSTTSEARFNEIRAVGILPYTVTLSAHELIADPDFFDCETLVISIPPRLRSGETDYAAKIQQLLLTVYQYSVKHVIYISSTGVYPDNNEEVNELITPQPHTPSGKILLAAEELIFNQPHLKAAIIRFGGLVGPGRHPGRFFAGKANIPNGQAPVNLIHLQDCVQLTQAIIAKQAYDYTFNACAPHHPPKAQFYTQAALHAGLEAPSFNDELLEWKTVNSINITKILQYEFAVNNWDECFANNCF